MTWTDTGVVIHDPALGWVLWIGFCLLIGTGFAVVLMMMKR